MSRALAKFNAYYRNHAGQIVRIVGELSPTSLLYQSGFRYFDDRGNYLTEDGRARAFFMKTLDLKTEVSVDDIDQETIDAIDARTKALATSAMSKVLDGSNDTALLVAGASLVGVTLGLLFPRRLRGA